MMGFSTTLAFFYRFLGHDRPRFAGAPSVGVARCRPVDHNDAHRSWVMDGFDPSCRARCVRQSAFLLLPEQLALLHVTLVALLPWGKILAALTTPVLLCGRQARCSLPGVPPYHSTVGSNNRGWCQRQTIHRWLIWRGTHTDEHNQKKSNGR